MDGIKLRSHLERLTNKVIKKSPKKKLKMDTDNKKTRRMVMQEHSEDLLKKENKRWLSKSKLKKEAVKKAEETMAEISMEWSNKYWEEDAEEEWTGEQVNACKNWVDKVHWTSPPKMGLEPKRMGFEIVTMNSAKAVSGRLLNPIVDYPESKLIRCFPLEIQPRAKFEMRRDAVLIFSLHVRLLAIQQWMINNCDDKAGLIKDGSWTFTDIFDEKLDELYTNRRELKRLREEFQETFDMISRITNKYTTRRGIISYEEIVNIIEFNYSESDYERTICWVKNLCNADPRFSTVEGSEKFKLRIESLNVLTKYLLGANEQADPTDKEKLMQLATVGIIEGDELPHIITDDGRNERSVIEIKKDKEFIREWNKSAIHLDIIADFDNNKLQTMRRILGKESVGASPRSSTQINPIRISRYAQPPDYNTVIGKWEEASNTLSPVAYPPLSENMINGTENVRWRNQNDDSGFYNGNSGGSYSESPLQAAGGQPETPHRPQTFRNNQDMGITQGVQQMSLESGDVTGLRTMEEAKQIRTYEINKIKEMEKTRLQKGNPIGLEQFADGYHDDSIRVLNTMERYIRAQNDQGLNQKEYSKCLVELGLNYTDKEINMMWKSIQRNESSAITNLDTERMAKLRELLMETKGNISVLKNNGPIRDKWVKFGAVEAERLRHNKEDVERIKIVIQDMERENRKSEEKSVKSDKKKKNEDKGIKQKKRNSIKDRTKNKDTDEDDPYDGYYDKKDKSKDKKKLKSSKKGYNLRMRNTNYDDDSSSESESDTSDSDSSSSSSDTDSEEEMDDPKQRERAERTYRNIAEFDRGDSAEQFLKRITSCIKRMFPKLKYKTGPTNKKRYELIFDKLSNEVQDRVDGSRDVHENNVHELEKFLKERMGKQEVDLAKLHNLVQMTIRPGEWADWIDQMENAVTKTENFKGKVYNKAERRHFDSICIDQILRVMHNKQKSLLATMRIIKPKKSEINYEDLREALLHSDSMDGIINAGEPSRREYKGYNEHRNNRRNMKASYENDEESEDENEYDKYEYENDKNMKTKNSSNKKRKNNKQYIKNTDMVNVEKKMQRQEEIMNKRMNEMSRERENEGYRRENWNNNRRERENMDDPLKQNVISQPIIITTPTAPWENDRIEEIMGDKVNQRWNTSKKPFNQGQQGNKNVNGNDYFRNNQENRNMGPRYDRRNQGMMRNYNGNQGNGYDQNRGGYNGQSNRRFNNYQGRNEEQWKSRRFSTIGGNFKGRRFNFEGKPENNYRGGETFNRGERDNNREYRNDRYVKMNNRGRIRGNNRKNREEEMRMRNTNIETQLTCYNCGRQGHMASSCNLPRRGNNDYQRNRPQFTCYNCGKPGHMSRDCTQQRVPICAACNGRGHAFQDCRTHEMVRKNYPKGTQVFINERLKCEGCRTFGHTIRDCIEYTPIKKNLIDQEADM